MHTSDGPPPQISKFFGALLCGIPISVFYIYQRERLALYWREKLTARILGMVHCVRLAF